MPKEKQIEPEIGMGGTIYLYSDRHACTVIRVASGGKRIVVQHDKAIRRDENGMSECQDYEYTPNPKGSIEVFTLRQNGRYIRQGEDMRKGTQLGLGTRREYYDYSF